MLVNENLEPKFMSLISEDTEAVKMEVDEGLKSPSHISNDEYFDADEESKRLL